MRNPVIENTIQAGSDAIIEASQMPVVGPMYNALGGIWFGTVHAYESAMLAMENTAETVNNFLF